LARLPYHSIPEPPGELTANSVLVRAVDGLGFRYRWATEGLREEDYVFRPCPTSMSVRELLNHIHRCVSITDHYLGGEKPGRPDFATLAEAREKTLEKIWGLRERIGGMTPDQLAACSYYSKHYGREFPVWNMINGPLSDALTHVGQINSWRRINGNPVPAASVFLGRPPEWERSPAPPLG
jgi:hypothetical protein